MFGPTGWSPLTFGVAFVVMDVLGQNEDVIHPDGIGGAYLRRALLTAYRDGWLPAWTELQIQRKHADERREGELGA